MFQFLNPIWLIGAAAIAIPVLIHSWNIRPGKVLKVGSIGLIDAASRKSSRSLKLLDIPLLILRCLVLTLLALVLALPVWQKRVPVVKAKGWILIQKENFKTTYQQFKPTVDSLTRAGYEFHYFNAGFDKGNIAQVLNPPKDAVVSKDSIKPTNQQTNYWNLIRQLDDKISSDIPVYLFTTNQAKYFTGAKPDAALQLHWQTYTPADSTSTWIQNAWFTPDGDIRLVQGQSRPSGTSYNYANIRQSTGNSIYNIQTNNGTAQISLIAGNQTPAVIDTTVQHIAIYADNNSSDAGYIKAALQAVNQFTQRKTVVKAISNPAQLPANTDWLFWLSEKTISQAYLNHCSHVLAYQPGKTITVNSWISNAGPYATAVADINKVNLYKLISAPEGIRTPVWQEASGKPVLAMEQQGKTRLYHFYSRFNPTWNNLVWNDNFPAWLLQLMQEPTSNTINSNEKRVLSRQQYLPRPSTDSHIIAASKNIETKNLSRYFWLALLLAFMAERWLAHRKTQTADKF
ncbi:BatA domain-containing protein [Mucilaginibacter sp. CSA2-8R]|uniref:BatA domain-containing protein n=1 Tax=Mucilaginibacter sp. CSA2-8R TaxID=3141542 RepID=UPI00315D6F20